MEWYKVDSWLGKQLIAVGEAVLDCDYGMFWGRQGTGQALIMDGVLQQIAEKFVREEE